MIAPLACRAEREAVPPEGGAPDRACHLPADRPSGIRPTHVQKRRWFAILGAGVLLWLIVAWFVAGQQTRHANDEQVAAARLSSAARVATIAKIMGQSIDNLHGIAAYIAQESDTVAGVLHTRPAPAGWTPEQRKQAWSHAAVLAPLSDHLLQAAKHLGVDAILVLNTAGDAIASSNVGTPASFVGTHYADRDYFKAAIAGLPGHQYAMGRKTNIPGLYFSAPIRREGGNEIIGVAVVKIELPRLAYWVNQADAFVSDEYDVVILARDTTEMRSLEMHALPAARVANLPADARQARYKRHDFPALALTVWGDARYPGVVAFGNTPVVMARQALPDIGIQVHVMEHLPTLADAAGQRRQRFLPLAASGSLLLLIVGGSLLFALQRRQSERNIAASLSLHQATIESTSDGILVLDLRGHVTTCNQRFGELWRMPPDLLARRDNQDMLAFAREQLRNPQGFMERVRENSAHPEKAAFDLLELTDGRVFERHTQPQRLDGKVVGRVVNFHDVTLRNKALEKLAQSELELQTIIDTEPECVKLIAADGTLLKMNRAGLGMIEADNPQSVIGQKVLGIIAPPYRAAFADLTRRVFQGETGKLEFEVVGLKGGHRWLDTHAVPLRDTHGNIIALLGLTRDISQRRAAEAERAHLQQQLQHAQKLEAIGQLTGGIAHDFNNILGAILGFTGLTLDRYGAQLPEKAVSYLNEVQKAGERARDLIQKMLAFARGSGGEAQLLDPHPLVKEVIKMLASTLPSSLELREQVAAGVPAVRMDPVQLHQILTNLVINARDATGGQGRIEVGLRLTALTGQVCDVCHQPVQGEFVELYVQDDGGGIAREVLPKIFDPFFTTKDVGKGSGMGLAMVMGILREHDGHALVESALGDRHGTTFRLFFHPANGHAPEALAPLAAVAVAETGGRHILVVDDEVPLGQLLGEVLDANAYRATVHANPRAALAAFQADPDSFDAVITDQTMPGMTGVELVHELLALRPNLPVFMVSGYSDKVDAETAEKHGIRRFFYKPVASAALLAALREALP